MSLASFPALKRLPNNQKLKLADELWRSGISDSMAVPTEQKSKLDARWAAYRAGEIKRISISELERRLARK